MRITGSVCGPDQDQPPVKCMQYWIQPMCYTIHTLAPGFTVHKTYRASAGIALPQTEPRNANSTGGPSKAWYAPQTPCATCTTASTLCAVGSTHVTLGLVHRPRLAMRSAGSTEGWAKGTCCMQHPIEPALAPAAPKQHTGTVQQGTTCNVYLSPSPCAVCSPSSTESSMQDWGQASAGISQWHMGWILALREGTFSALKVYIVMPQLCQLFCTDLLLWGTTYVQKNLKNSLKD